MMQTMIERTAILGREPRILIVDDEPANLLLLATVLRKAGYNNLVAIQDPRQVVARYVEAAVDLVVLDLNMPLVDGFAVMERIRRLDDRLQAPVLVLTAQRSGEHVIAAFSAGARDFVSKPFDIAELLARVRNLLDAHLAQRLMHERQAVLEEVVRQRTHALQISRLQVLQRLGQAAEFRDEETGNHILRMSHTAALLAGESGWSDEDTELLLNAAPMHDIGKIGIPDRILRKPGPLDAAEWAVMRTHCEIGARLLKGEGELMEQARAVAWTHHEKWDGSGYPRGLRGEEIPAAGRLCAIADVFDALLSVRPYKRAWSVDSAVRHIRSEAGRHFDPEAVRVFDRCLPQILDIRARYPDV